MTKVFFKLFFILNYFFSLVSNRIDDRLRCSLTGSIADVNATCKTANGRTESHLSNYLIFGRKRTSTITYTKPNNRLARIDVETKLCLVLVIHNVNTPSMLLKMRGNRRDAFAKTNSCRIDEEVQQIYRR